tara:strand:+ start:26 stop:331 length:306 start_codon:yes stop_codon:yes gene_type:complete
MAQKTYTQKEVSVIFHKNERTIRRWVAEGIIPRTRIKGELKITKAGLDQVKPPPTGGRDNVEIGKLRVMLQELIQILRSTNLTKEEQEKLRQAENMVDKWK